MPSAQLITPLSLTRLCRSHTTHDLCYLPQCSITIHIHHPCFGPVSECHPSWMATSLHGALWLSTYHMLSIQHCQALVPYKAPNTCHAPSSCLTCLPPWHTPKPSLLDTTHTLKAGWGRGQHAQDGIGATGTDSNSPPESRAAKKHPSPEKINSRSHPCKEHHGCHPLSFSDIYKCLNDHFLLQDSDPLGVHCVLGAGSCDMCKWRHDMGGCGRADKWMGSIQMTINQHRGCGRRCWVEGWPSVVKDGGTGRTLSLKVPTLLTSLLTHLTHLVRV